MIKRASFFSILIVCSTNKFKSKCALRRKKHNIFGIRALYVLQILFNENFMPFMVFPYKTI